MRPVETAPTIVAAGLCICGCGNPTPLAKRTRAKVGNVKGQPVRFIPLHHRRVPRRQPRAVWGGDEDGYVRIQLPDHPRADHGGYVFEHILVAERALGKFLVQPAVVHHVNEQRRENHPTNLVICEDVTYHQLLHARMRMIADRKASGKVCRLCGVRRPFDQFVRRAKNVDGLYSWCKDCKHARAATDYRKTHVIRTGAERVARDIKLGGKVCGHCKNRRPPSSFGVIRRALDGLSHICRDCWREIRQQRKVACSG